MTRRFFFVLFLVLFLLSVVLLSLGLPVLERPVIGRLPFGNLLAWTAAFALPTCIFFGVPRIALPRDGWDRAFRSIFVFLMFLGACFGLAAFALAGNWSASFQNPSPTWRGSSQAGQIYFAYAGLMVLLPAALIIIYALGRTVRRMRGK